MTVTEIRGMAGNRKVPLPDQPYLRVQSPVSLSSASASSTAIGASCSLAEISLDVEAHVKVRASGDVTDATTSNTRYQPGVYHLDVKPGYTIAARTP